MTYWRGDETSKKESAQPKDNEYERMIEARLSRKRPGRDGSLSLEQEFFLTVIRLCLGLLVKDLAFRFKISTAQVTRVFHTWVKRMA